MNKKAINDLKYNYNHYLKRYENGCNYLGEHTDEIDKWLPELMEIMEILSSLLEEIQKYEKINSDDILNGFKLE